MAISIHPKDDNTRERNIAKIIRDKKEKEYFDIKIIAFVLVDLVPYNRKNEMILGLEQLFSKNHLRYMRSSIKDSISDITEGAFSYFSAPIGSIKNLARNSTLNAQPIQTEYRQFREPNAVDLHLPAAIDRIDITVRQDVNFCYYVDYFCHVNESYRYTRLKNTYLSSDDLIPYFESGRLMGERRKGPDNDAVVLGYETEVADFLSKFSAGLFLSNKESSEGRIPSVRIFSTQSIDFSNFTDWNEKHWSFLRYLGMNIYHDIDTRAKIYTLQGDRIFQKSSVSKGVNILYSENDIPGEDLNKKIDTMLGDAKVFNDAIGDYFLPLYWSNYNIFQILESWKDNVEELILKIKSKNYTLKELEEKVMQTIDLYADLTIYESEERINIRSARETFNINKNLVGPPNFTIHLYKFKLFKDISELIENCFNQEEVIINDIEKQINALTSYFRDRSNLKLSFSNLSLQKRLKWFTISLSIVGTVISALPFIMKYLGLFPE